MDAIEWLRQGLDLVRGRYQAFIVEGDQDRTAVLAVLDEVRRVELNRVTGSSVLESSAFQDLGVVDGIVAVRDTDTGRVVGCVRATDASQLVGEVSSREEYLLDRVPREILDKMSVVTRFAVLREFRKTAASWSIMQKMYAEGLARGYLGCLMTCEPGLYTTYARLGFRPLGPMHASNTGGFRMPMVLINHDAEWMARAKSPLRGMLKKHRGPRPQVAAEWYRALAATPPGVRSAYQPFRQTDSGVHELLTREMSARGASQLLAHAIAVECSEGHVIIKEGDGGRFMGLVMEGAVTAVIGDQVLGTLRPGEPFGELAILLKSRRTARVVAAAPQVKVLVLSASAIERVSRPADRAALWRNLATHVATRLIAREAPQGAAPQGA